MISVCFIINHTVNMRKLPCIFKLQAMVTLTSVHTGVKKNKGKNLQNQVHSAATRLPDRSCVENEYDTWVKYGSDQLLSSDQRCLRTSADHGKAGKGSREGAS